MAEEKDDVFNEVETEVETEKGAEEEAKEEPEAKAEEESKEETKEESPASENVSKSEAGLVATAQAERLRRQDAEAERDELKKQLEGQKKEPEVIPDAATDPDGHNRFLDNKFFAQKLEMSEEMLGDSQSDYGELKVAFTNLVSEIVDGVATVKDQALYKNFRQARSPAKFLVDHMGSQSKLTEVSDPGYESKQEEKYRKKFIAEAKEKGLTAMELPDLTTEAAAGSNTVSVEYDGKDDMWDEQPAG